MENHKICHVCGEEYPESEMTGDMCLICASSILQDVVIDLGLGDEFN